MALIISLCTAAGCQQNSRIAGLLAANTVDTTAADSGVLYLKVNPQIAVHYDEQGVITSVEGVNDDGKAVLTDTEIFAGRPWREVGRELVLAIDKAGYFTEEIDGKNRRIVIEIGRGSVVPDYAFLDDVVAGVKDYTSTMHINSDIDVDDQAGYDYTDYSSTNYTD